MRIDAAAWPFIGGSLVLAALAGWLSSFWAAAPFLALSAVFVFFFRDPERVVPQDSGLVLSPADGRVMVAGEPDGRRGPPGRWQQITIFLSPMDVHVNRMPVDGRVAKVEYYPGRFLPAYRADAGDLNEHTQVTIERNGYHVVVRQIVGVLARRIVCRVKPGDLVRAGDRFGVMKFGSRMDVFLPAHAVVAVTVGDRVVGGVTVLARLDQ